MAKKITAKKPTMSTIPEVDKWTNELDLLFSILRSTELKEETKWGAPCFTIDGKNVIGVGGFKAYVGLWFHQGVFLKDSKKLLVNASEGKTKSLRQMRFNSINEIDEKIVRSYVNEAIENAKQGKEIKPEKKGELEIPTFVKAAFKKDKLLNQSFKKLTPFIQREYIEYISSAKQDKTQLARLDKIIPLVKEGKGLNDKYRK